MHAKSTEDGIKKVYKIKGKKSSWHHCDRKSNSPLNDQV